MDKAEAISLLHRFLILEKFEYEHYVAQMQAVDNYKLMKALERFAIIELEHMHKIEKMLVELGEQNEGINLYTKAFFENVGGLVGTVAGNISEKMGLINMLRFSIFGEKNAVNHYDSFISKVEDDDLKNMLWENRIDEEMHQKWMEDYLGQLESPENNQKT